MRNILSLLTIKTTIPIVAILCIIQSCDKNETENANCLAIVVPDTLRFNVVDKNTGEDLFFSNSPVYTTDRIHFNIPDATVIVKPRVETSSRLGKHFLIAVHTGNVSGTIKLYIANNLEHTMQYSVKKDENEGCPKYVFDMITVNGTQTERNINGRVILLKK